jgi:hypothetical protein
MIHLCGVHTQHLAAFREMRELRAVQLNDRAAEDMPAYLDGLRDDQVIYLDPTPTTTAEQALEMTGGRRLVLVGEHSHTCSGRPSVGTSWTSSTPCSTSVT